MHHCLKIPEIVQTIFERLSDADESPDVDPEGGINFFAPPLKPYGSVALARLARTCRWFMDPALEILWREQDLKGLLPLLQCFPRQLWEITPRSGAQRATFRFRTSISPSDWDRVLFYSARIEILRIGSGPDLTPEVMQALNLSLPTGACLFPNLRRLVWWHQDHCFPFIRLFLGPKITAIDLTFPPAAAHLSLLPYLTSNYPSLTEVGISGGILQADETGVLSTFILALDEVQRVSVPRVSPATYRHLACLPSLTSLMISNIDEPLVIPGNDSRDVRASFPVLRLLCVRMPAIDLATNFITGFSDTPLQDLDMESDEVLNCASLHKFLVTLRANCTHSSLKFIHLRIGTLHRADLGGPSGITLKALGPLLTFINLQQVTIASPLGFSLDDNDIAELAQAWPQIESLDLSMATASSREPTVTIGVLAHFARHCPRLTTLTLCLNPTGLVQSDAFPAPHEPRLRQTALTHLCVLYSPIDSSILVARFLSAMFPSLRQIDTSHGNWSNDIDEDPEDPEVVTLLSRWKEVAYLIPLFVAVRTDEERYWMAQSGDGAPNL